MSNHYETIKEVILENKDDKMFCSNLFRMFTENDTIKNYSHNNNGIFFNFRNIPQKNINHVLEFLKEYRRREEEKIKYEQERNKIIEDGNKSSVINKLAERIQKSVVLHTDISMDEDLEQEEIYEEDVQMAESDDEMVELFGEGYEDD